MSDETDTPVRPRTSRFKEHTNTNSSIRPPPDELWKDLGIEKLIEQFNEENQAPPILSRKTSGNSAASHGSRASRGAAAVAHSRATSEARTPGVHDAQSTPGVFGAPPATPVASEGTFGRFRSAFASVFGGVLGKRKTGLVDAEKEKEKQVLDQRKKAADAAYQEAKELGLLPTPKVFVRPSVAARSHKCGMQLLRSEDTSGVKGFRLTPMVADAATPVRAPRTPTLHRSPSKKDLNKQKKLSKRVSDLEFKLASARKELQSVLYSDNLPPVPPLPAILPPTPDTSQGETDTEPPNHMLESAPAPAPALVLEQHIGKTTKKRKAATIDDDAEYKPTPTDSDGDIDMPLSASEPDLAPERTIKRVKSSASRKNLKRQSSRLLRKKSRSSMARDDAVTVVPDGVSVPPIPLIPKGVKGKKVSVGDDGYGGLGHEMF